MGRDDHTRFLWRNLERLGGVERPVAWRWEGPGLPSLPRPCRTNLAVLGQEWCLRRPAAVDALLDVIGRDLSLDADVWRSQRPFLREYVGGFFTMGDGPAWVKMYAVRTGFARRTEDAGWKPVHRASLHDGDPLPLRGFAAARLALDGFDLPRTTFRAFHPLARADGLGLQRIYIHRMLKAAPGARALPSTEERLVPVFDDEDVRLARRGVTPALERHRDRQDVHASPLISISRIDARGRIASRCFSLSPLVGEIGDLRAMTYDPEYYFRSDMTSHAVLEKLVTRGAAEPF